jgi:GAF domain-containing protein
MADRSTLHEELARVTLVDRDLADILTEIAGIARRSITAAEAVSITLIRGETAFTAAYDGQLALDADELQYQRGYGPCMDAGRASQTFLVEDMQTEQRWPDYARHVARLGVRSSLSIPLPFQGATIGALNVYARRPKAFGAEDTTASEEVAAWVALAVGNADAAARTHETLTGLRTAMLTRSVIDQAKGILMERYKVTADQAFTLLTHSSQNQNRKLRDIAAALVETGELPGKTYQT